MTVINSSIDFNNVNTFPSMDHKQEGKEKSIDYKSCFDQILKEFKELHAGAEKEEGKAKWKQSLINFSKIRLLSDEFEDRIFESFKDQKEVEFELRYRSLCGLYKALNWFQQTKKFSPNNKLLVDEIRKLTEHIFKRQGELYKLYTTYVDEESKRKVTLEDFDELGNTEPTELAQRYAWERLYDKTNNYILDTHIRETLVSNITVLWVDSRDEFPLLKRRLHQLATGDDKVFLFSNVKASLKKIATLPLSAGQYTYVKESMTPISSEKKRELQIKEIYKALSFFNFDEEQEVQIFKILSGSNFSSKISFVDFKDFCSTRFFKRLRAMENACLADEKLLSQLSKAIEILGSYYSTDQFKQLQWNSKYSEIQQLSRETDRNSLLELFTRYKPSESEGYLTSALNGLAYVSQNLFSIFKSHIVDGQAIWKGKKFELMLKDMLHWVAANKTSIEEKIERDDQDNSTTLQGAVRVFVSNLEAMKIPMTTEDATQDERELYNMTVCNLYQKCLTDLRALLSMPEFEEDVKGIEAALELRAAALYFYYLL